VTRRAAAALAGALLSAAACAPAEGPLMAPGRDCLSCHDGGAARRWTAAGTWSRANQHVTIRDANGKSFTIRTNRVGNFYTAEPLAFPLQVSVDGRAMPVAVNDGSCNRCHARGQAAVTGPLMAAGQDCLGCHDGRGAVAFSAAGTWGGADATVTITDAAQKVVTLVTNQVGNFYTSEPLAFPLTVRVGTRTMPDPVTYGGCNECHGTGGTALVTGPLMAPGQDCLSCHDGASAVAFSAAGTWGGPGATVTITDAARRVVTLVTNEVGNFYTSQQLAFPLTVRVGNETMPDPVTWGGCNKCHGPGGSAEDD
jgi:predicted CXXCH cytochrome family protein